MPNNVHLDVFHVLHDPWAFAINPSRHPAASSPDYHAYRLYLCAFWTFASSEGHTSFNAGKSAVTNPTVLRIGDLGKVYDISGIQQYTINNGKVIFLRARPQLPK